MFHIPITPLLSDSECRGCTLRPLFMPEGGRYRISFQKKCIIQRVYPLLGNDLETNNDTTSAASKQILNKQVYAVVTE
jgi:hypothetical protein